MQSVIVGYARTPFVKQLGVFGRVPAVELGAVAARAALASAGIEAERVDAVIGGQVLQAAEGQNPIRQTAVAAGVPLTVPAVTLNAVCLSGTEAVAQANRLIASGEAECVLALGQESMSRAPHAVRARAGLGFGPGELVDTMQHDGLRDAFEERSMGESTQAFADAAGLGRQEQDEFAARSHAHAARAAREGLFDAEIAPVEVRERGRERVIEADDGIRPDTDAPTLARLRPAFAGQGTITAGNASQISDGAAALVLASPAWAQSRGVEPIAAVLACALVAGPDVSLLHQPANAIRAALERAGRRTSELAAVEINEAFAAVGLVSTRALGVDPGIVNPLGGAIALGHPIGASGARIAGSLARQLQRLGPDRLGAAGICGGGGQGSALVLRSL
ncbi:MAG: acetyl-CoA C-acyltransferase [Pseudoclavibacter sp.]|nr:acetyl-CoA C-acyltransferase [Pseudoclavibacter sp.]